MWVLGDSLSPYTRVSRALHCQRKLNTMIRLREKRVGRPYDIIAVARVDVLFTRPGVCACVRACV